MLWSAWSLEAKLVTIISCGIVIALSVLIVICFLVPDTWWTCPWSDQVLGANQDDSNQIRLKDFHQYSQADDAQSIHTISTMEDDTIRPTLSRSELCYTSPSCYSLDSGRPGSGRESSSNASSVISESGISPCISRSDSLTTLTQTDDRHLRPQVHLTLQSVRMDDKSDINRKDQLLLVTIENATDLPSRSYVETVDPCVSVRLERRSSQSGLMDNLMGALIGGSGSIGGRGRRHGQLLAEDSTCPVVYHSRHPRFHHAVTLPVPKSTQLKDCQLVLKVEDKDKLVGSSELAHCRIDLRELDLLAGWLEGNNEQESTVRLSRFLDTTKSPEKGAILLGLSFLPTSQRITVQITQCNRLVKMADEAASLSTPTKAVVRLFLLNDTGRVLKKRKTAPFDYPKGGGGKVELNEIFHLDVDIERWDRSVVLIVLSRIKEQPVAPPTNEPTLDQNKASTPSAASASVLESGGKINKTSTTRSPPVYMHTGHVALGKRVAGHAERIHWNSAFQSPRRVISQWHSLH